MEQFFQNLIENKFEKLTPERQNTLANANTKELMAMGIKFVTAVSVEDLFERALCRANIMSG
jgi:hypothetical protein